ncbi:MAG: hypothetical protein HDR80_07130 [Bacteroides sp.]|nr:hypothetical protein [Bacteroides sp.]
MTKKTLIYASALLALTACSDEDFKIPGEIGPDGELTLMFNMAEMTQVSTRAADPDAVNDLTVLVLDNGTIKQIPDIDASPVFTNGKASVSFTLDPALRADTPNLEFVVVCNKPSDVTFAANTEYADVADASFEFDLAAEDYVTMSGSATFAKIAGGASIPIYRNVAKVSAIAASENEGTGEEADKYTEGTTRYPVAVYGTATDVTLSGEPQSGTYTLPGNDDALGTDTDAVLVNPTSKTGDRPYVIVKAPFDGTEYYYRVNFEKLDSEGNVETLAVERNHEYKIYVLGVAGKGYASPLEAAKNPVGLLETEIVDVCLESYNMITDGVRELGVSDKAVFSGSASSVADEWNQTTSFFVKVYSPVEGEEEDFGEDNISIDCDWLTFVSVQENTGKGNIGGGSGEFTGKVYEVTLRLKKTIEPGTLETNIGVNWMGLTRTVPIIYERDFNAADLISNAVLTMHNEDGDVVVNDYFGFLGGAADGKKLYGVDKASMAGDSIRNEGLHFPVMYGSSASSRATYSYELTYAVPVETAYDYEFAALGISGISFESGAGLDARTGSKAAGQGIHIKVTCTETGYNYQVGTFRLRVKAQGTSKWVNLDLDTYHTGFFHRENTSYAQSSSAGTQDYCYYEVLRDRAQQNYWLDRNLGAHTNRMYVETSSGDAYYPAGEKLEAGAYYHATVWGGKNGENDYNKAKVFADGSDSAYPGGFCPPGWEIPTKAVWADLRSSQYFRTSQIDTYFDSSLAMDGGRRMYFPKYGYYNNGIRQGSSRAGYYWTATPADGLEKDEIQKWMQMFVLEGVNPGFERAAADQSTTVLDGAAMAIRCIHKDNNDEGTSNRTYFNVSGATHVYVYTQDGTNRTAATSWPGQFIGNYQNMEFSFDDPEFDQLFYFTYTSTTAAAEQLYVIFNYTDSNGQIHSISRRTAYEAGVNTDSSARHTVGTNPANLNGWKVTGDRVENAEGETVTTALGGYWHLAYEGSSAKIVYSNAAPGVRPDYIIEWPNTGGQNNILVQYADGTYPSDFTGGLMKSNTGTNGSNYVYRFAKAPSKEMNIWIAGADPSQRSQYKSTVKVSDFVKESETVRRFKVSDINSFQSNVVELVTAYVYDMANWGSIVAMALNGANDGLTDAATLIESSNGVSGYRFRIPKDCTMFRFQNANGTQYTQAIPFTSADKNNVFFNSLEDGMTYKPVTNYKRVVIKDNDNWSNSSYSKGVAIYNWSGSSKMAAWPGELMHRWGNSLIYWFDIRYDEFIINNYVSDAENSDASNSLQKRQTLDKAYVDFEKGKVLVVSNGK